MNSPHLSARERAAVLWAEHVTLNTAKERDDVYEIVRKEFSDPELFELTAATALFNLSNRVQDSLRFPIEEESEVNKIRTSVRTHPQKLKAYLQRVVDDWPDEMPEPRG
jgi:hypothetical protein